MRNSLHHLHKVQRPEPRESHDDLNRDSDTAVETRKESEPVTEPQVTRKERREPTPEEFRAMQKDPRFLELKKTYRSFTFPMSVAFFVWYMAYAVTAIAAPEFMARDAFGGMNIGVIFGLLQFVTTFVITYIYVGYANRNIEPQAAAIREAMEG